MSPTVEETQVADAQRILRVIHLLSVSAMKPISDMSILDLASRVGAFASPLSEIGADVVGIEGRQSNIDQAPNDDVTYYCADVRTLSHERFGRFDATLCLGLLYHLGAEDVVRLLRAIYDVTTDIAIIDTHVSLLGENLVEIDGVTYAGRVYQDVDAPWGSIGNSISWWFTPDALEHILEHVVGFSRVERITGRGWHNESPDRMWWVVYR
jgi:hypothetical protein